MNFDALNSPEKRWLAIDASRAQCAVGVLSGDGRWLAFTPCRGGALEGLREGVQAALGAAAMRIEEIDGFLYCEGPGSVLGLRLAAMMLRVWRTVPALAKKPVFAWRTLPFIARACGGAHSVVVTPARQGHGCVFQSPDIWEERPTAELVNLREKTCLFLPQRKQWENPPDFFKTVPDDLLEKHPRALLANGLLHPVETPDNFVMRQAQYRAWNAPALS